MADTHESIQSESESNASELSLSCGSSSFEDGENVSDAETEDAGQANNVEINPYQYEPYRNDSDDSDQDGETENTPLDRQNDTSW
jgi:hypothetical protein